MFADDSLRRFMYLVMEVQIIAGVGFVLWIFHLPFLRSSWRQILLGVLLVSAYTLPIDALSAPSGWGGINQAYVSGIYLFGGSLLLEEVVFWVGTSFVTISAVTILMELERRRVPWRLVAAGVVLPIEWLASRAGIGARHPGGDP